MYVDCFADCMTSWLIENNVTVSYSAMNDYGASVSVMYCIGNKMVDVGW